MQSIEALQGWLDRSGKEGVGVCLGLRRVTGMKPMGFLAGIKDTDRLREQGVESSAQGRAGNGGFGVKIGDHSLGVDTCICSAGAVQGYWMIGYDMETLFNLSLDGAGVFLSLPAAIACSVKGDKEFYVAHGRCGADSHR